MFLSVDRLRYQKYPRAPSTQLLVSNITLFNKRHYVYWKNMAELRTRPGNMQDGLERLIVPRSKQVLRKQKSHNVGAYQENTGATWKSSQLPKKLTSKIK